MRSALDTAMALCRRGLSIIPVPPPRGDGPEGQPGDGKTPAISWKAYQTHRATEPEIRSWFGGPAAPNVAIVCGAISQIIVVDLDSDEAVTWARRHLPRTPWVVRTARGFHVYYAHPGELVRNRARLATRDGRLAIDVRGDGGYVIGPGSVHRTGVRYELAGNWSVPRDALPTFRPAWIARPTPAPAPRRHGPRPTGDVVERARRYLAAIPPPEIGGGSDVATLRAAARLVRGFDLDEQTATDLLWERFGGRPGWSPGWVAAKVRNAERYGSEPVGGLL